MCGLVGFITRGERANRNSCSAMIAEMTRTLQHRGPDSSGTWVDPAHPVALGHRRLSIIDLTSEGHQPMLSEDGRRVIVYNGEIYNYLEIKKELQAALSHPGGIDSAPLHFRGHSDTEVLLAAITVWGLEETLKHLNGMFAFALWDREDRSLSLVRDRFGKKPLYLGWVNGSFVFGSELKAFKAFPGFANEVDRGALAQYLRHNCIPSPHSIYRKIYKLPPGCKVTLGFDQVLEADSYEEIAPLVQSYWSAEKVFDEGLHKQAADDPEAVEEQLDTLLRDAVRCRMISDVPLGAFLSGGIDSSLVVALMQAQSAIPVKTYTIGFQEASHNEAEDARRVAEHLGTDHHELYLAPKDVLDVVPLLPVLYDEPFADSSQIPTYLISKFARQEVTVALSGDGGDEIFGGYNRYSWAPEIWGKMRRWPKTIRRLAASLLSGVPPSIWPHVLKVLAMHHRTPADKIMKIAAFLREESPGEIYRSLVSHWQEPALVVMGGVEPPTALMDGDRIIDRLGFATAMMYLDQITYLPDDILVKVDRASMGVSLEVRAPLLDYRLAEFTAALPLDQKIREKKGKHLLRKILCRYVPRECIERPKMGFEMPIGDWLRADLREWAEELLSETRLRNDGYFNPLPVRKKWAQHITGKRNWQFHLWDILMFQAWLERQ